MQDLSPPRNVILKRQSAHQQFYISTTEPSHTHKFEYTPGIRATDSGSGDNHLSGFHSWASSPQTALFLLHPRILIMTPVFLGTGISSIHLPSTPRIGSDNGSVMSFLQLGKNIRHAKDALKPKQMHALSVNLV